MNLLNLLGAAVSCPDFCNLLFEDPVLAAQLLGFTLTRHELELLQQTFDQKSRDAICGAMGTLREMICKQPPCNMAPVVPGRGDLCSQKAA